MCLVNEKNMWEKRGGKYMKKKLLSSIHVALPMYTIAASNMEKKRKKRKRKKAPLQHLRSPAHVHPKP